MSSYGIVEVSREVETGSSQGASLKGSPYIRSIDKDNFKQQLVQIYEYRHTLASKLPYAAGITLESLKATLSSIADSVLYNEFHQLIIDKFATTKEEYYPGTVGAILVGCYQSRDHTLGSCHLSCAGQVPLPAGEMQPCTCAVLVAHWVDQQYIFHINYYGGTHQALLYFERFHGLSPSEIDYLRLQGFHQVKLYEYGSHEAPWSSSRLRPLTNDFITLDQIPCRSVDPVTVSQPKTYIPRSYWVLVIVVLIFVIIITAIITYLITKNVHKNSKP